MNIEKINININNDVLNLRRKEEIRIANSDIYAYPNRKYNYNINLSGIENNFYINNGNPVTGLFEEITFCSDTFFDSTLFKNVTFKKCNFNNISIRWCTFQKCKFISCKGYIGYIRATTFKKDCICDNTDIDIKFVDEYMYFNTKRYGYPKEIK